MEQNNENPPKKYLVVRGHLFDLEQEFHIFTDDYEEALNIFHKQFSKKLLDNPKIKSIFERLRDK